VAVLVVSVQLLVFSLLGEVNITIIDVVKAGRARATGPFRRPPLGFDSCFHRNA
jgi:hypothetical protein